MRRSWRSLVVILTMFAFAMTFSVVAGSEPDPEFSCFTVADEGPAGGEDDAAGSDLLTAVNPDDPDPDTNEVDVGSTGTDDIEAVAFQPGTGVLFAADGGQLGTLDLSSGTFSPKASPIGTGEGSEGEVEFNSVDGLTFDPATGTLYGSQRDSDGPDLLIVIDPSSGAHVSDAFGAGNDYVVIDPVEGPDGELTDIDDLAIREGPLFAIANEDGEDDRLVIIDPTNGDTSDVGPLGIEDVEGLGFSADGRLLGSTGQLSDVSAVLLIDTATGQASVLAEIDNGIDYESIDCREAPEPPGTTIGGTKWNDRNENGIQDESEEGVEGVEIHLFNEDGSVHEHTVTAADGSYAFDVSPGTYTVCETLPAGNVQTFPTEGPDCSDHEEDNDDEGDTSRSRDDSPEAREADDDDDDDDDGGRRSVGHEVTVEDGEQSLDNDFGNTAREICNDGRDNDGDGLVDADDPDCNVSGSKWNDVNADGVRDEGEEGVGGVRIHLFDEDGSIHLHTKTGREGVYGFFRVPAGTYTVCEQLPEGTTQTFPTEGPDCTPHQPDRGGPIGPVGHEATVERGEPSRGNDFGNTGGECPEDLTQCNITGTKWNDVNGDGVRDADEAGVGGVDIDIFQDGAEVTPPGTDVTNPDGTYGFKVEPGTYVVCEVPPGGPTTQTFPTEGADCAALGADYAPVGYEITIAGDEKSEGNDFGNEGGGNGCPVDRDACNITGTKWNDANGDGVRDAEEVGVPDVDIDIFQDGVEVTPPGTDLTESDGFYGFDVEPGTYVVCEVLPAGRTQTFPTEGADCAALGADYAAVGYEITIAGDEKSEDNDFGNIAPTCDDPDGDGIDHSAFDNDSNEGGLLSAPIHELDQALPSPIGGDQGVVTEVNCAIVVTVEEILGVNG